MGVGEQQKWEEKERIKETSLDKRFNTLQQYFFFLFLNLQHTVCSAAPTKTSQILDIDIAS